MLDLSAFQKINMKRCLRWETAASREWTLAEWTNAMAGECGEACNISKKLLRDDLGMVGNFKVPHKELREKLGDELADVVIYASLTAERLGIDLGDRIKEVFNKKSEQLGFEDRA
jgi:NTP pyrophosphatase (non-canonical NTP hydrolase)